MISCARKFSKDLLLTLVEVGNRFFLDWFFFYTDKGISIT